MRNGCKISVQDNADDRWDTSVDIYDQSRVLHVLFDKHVRVSQANELEKQSE